MCIVSVIIPTYKRSDYLIRCIESVLNQTYKNIQIIVVDDNNPNTNYRFETEKKMKKYINESKVIYLKHDYNKNGSAARNTGFKASKGEYICFLDDDDFFLPNKIEEQIKYLNNNTEFDGCFCDYKLLNKEIIVNYKNDFTKDIFLLRPTPQTSGWLLKRYVINELNGFDETYYRHQDYEFLLRFYNFGFKMGKTNKVLYCRDISNISNEPIGIKQELIKNKFLFDFEYIINQFNSNLKKRVFIKNYSKIFEGYVRILDSSNSFRIIKNMFNIDFSLTCSYFFLHFSKACFKKLFRVFLFCLKRLM